MADGDPDPGVPGNDVVSKFGTDLSAQHTISAAWQETANIWSLFENTVDGVIGGTGNISTISRMTIASLTPSDIYDATAYLSQAGQDREGMTAPLVTPDMFQYARMAIPGLAASAGSRAVSQIDKERRGARLAILRDGDNNGANMQSNLLSIIGSPLPDDASGNFMNTPNGIIRRDINDFLGVDVDLNYGEQLRDISEFFTLNFAQFSQNVLGRPMTQGNTEDTRRKFANFLMRANTPRNNLEQGANAYLDPRVAYEVFRNAAGEMPAVMEDGHPKWVTYGNDTRELIQSIVSGFTNGLDRDSILAHLFRLYQRLQNETRGVKWKFIDAVAKLETIYIDAPNPNDLPIRINMGFKQSNGNTYIPFVLLLPIYDAETLINNYFAPIVNYCWEVFQEKQGNREPTDMLPPISRVSLANLAPTGSAENVDGETNPAWAAGGQDEKDAEMLTNVRVTNPYVNTMDPTYDGASVRRLSTKYAGEYLPAANQSAMWRRTNDPAFAALSTVDIATWRNADDNLLTICQISEIVSALSQLLPVLYDMVRSAYQDLHPRHPNAAHPSTVTLWRIVSRMALRGKLASTVGQIILIDRFGQVQRPNDQTIRSYNHKTATIQQNIRTLARDIVLRV